MRRDETYLLAEAWAEPLSRWLVEESVRRQYELVFGSLGEDLKLVGAAHERLMRLADSRDPARVAIGARALATVALAMAGRMEWCAAFAAGARATLEVEPGDMPAPPPAANDKEMAKAQNAVTTPFIANRIEPYVMTKAHKRAMIEGQRRARAARAARKASGSGPEA